MADVTPPSVLDRLRQRVRTDGSAPLLTYYDLDSGERTELSVRSYANWVDKATNLFGSLDAADGGTVASVVARDHPGHWISLIVPLAAWQAGARVLVTDRAGAAAADVVVLGPLDPEPVVPDGTLAASLHPLALPLRDLPDGVADFSSETLAQPDQVWISPPVLANGVAWVDADRTLSHREVSAVEAVAGRVLVRPSDPWTSLRQAIVAPLLGGGSAVVVVGADDPERVARIAAAERCVG